MPFEPIIVSTPSGNFSIISMHCASRSACITASSVASGLPIRTLSRILILRSLLSWKTYETYFISSSDGMFLTSAPPIFIEPLFTSQKRAIREQRVVFPPPEGPTTAICSPAFIFIVIPSTALLSALS